MKKKGENTRRNKKRELQHFGRVIVGVRERKMRRDKEEKGDKTRKALSTLQTASLGSMHDEHTSAECPLHPLPHQALIL